MGQLQDIVRCPASEKCQAYGHCHTRHLSCAHPQAELGQWSNCSRHVLENFEEDTTDDQPRQSKSQEELVESEPEGISGWVGEQEGTAD